MTEAETEQTWARMSSRELAALVGRQHDDVLQSIVMLDRRGDLVGPLCPPPGGGERDGTDWCLGKRDTAVVVAQLALEMTTRLADRWQEIEAAPRALDTDRILHELAELRAALFPAPVARQTGGDAAEGEPDWARCLAHLLAQEVSLHEREAAQPVARWIVRAARLPGWQALDALGDPKDVQTGLRCWGIGVVQQGREVVIEVATRHPTLVELFQDTPWSDGQHRLSLARVPGAMAAANTRTMAGIGTRVTVIPPAALHRWLLTPEAQEQP